MIRRSRRAPLAGALLTVAGLVACGVEATDDGRSGLEGPTPTTSVDRELSSSEVLERLRGSVAYVETAFGSGSAVLLRDGFLVTNAHVVDPYDEVWVEFEDGATHDRVPVRGVDLVADLALLGPIETDRPAAEVGEAAALDDGADLYLVGFPGDQDDDLEATLARGVLSRRRSAKAWGLDFLQSDTTIGHGQSGGALVDARGRVVGLSGLGDEDGFALSLAMEQVVERTDRIKVGERSDWSPVPTFVVDERARFDPASVDAKALYFDGRDGAETVTVTVDGPAPLLAQFDPGFWPVAANAAALDQGPDSGIWSVADDGDEVEADEGGRSWTFDVEEGYDTIIVVGAAPGATGEVVVTTDTPFAMLDILPVPDAAAVGDEVVGTLGYLDNTRTYEVPLEAGDDLRVLAQSATGDVAVRVVAPGQEFWDGEEFDDGGGGLFDLDAAGTYEAEETGTHQVHVFQLDGAPTEFRLTLG